MSERSITVSGGERELVNVSLDRQFEPFALAVTDRAVYVSELARRSFSRRYAVQRVPIERVTRVVVQRTKLGTKFVWATIMVVSGGVLTALMMLSFLSEAGGRVILLPIALILGGFILPFAARGHRTLRIEFAGRAAYRWSPSMFLGDVTKQHVSCLMEQIVKAFRSLRIYVHEDSS